MYKHWEGFQLFHLSSPSRLHCQFQSCQQQHASSRLRSVKLAGIKLNTLTYVKSAILCHTKQGPHVASLKEQMLADKKDATVKLTEPNYVLSSKKGSTLCQANWTTVLSNKKRSTLCQAKKDNTLSDLFAKLKHGLLCVW